MKTITLYMLFICSVSFGMNWEMRNFDLPNPESIWEIARYTQNDADGSPDIDDDQVGKVWWMKYNPAYELNDSNSVELAVDLWAKNGWFTLVWVDGESGEHHPIASSSGAEGRGYYRISVKVDKSHPLADQFATANGELTTSQMLARELPPPKYGTWYAGMYQVDILESSYDGHPIESPVPPDSGEPVPPLDLEQGFPSQVSIDVDPVTGQLHCVFEPVIDGSELPQDAAGFSIQASTNLVSSEWYHIGHGLEVILEPTESELFLRLQYDAPE